MAKIHSKTVLITISILICSLLIGCASNKKPKNPIDPYEKYNRNMFKFNDTLDKAILKPTATVYNKVMPRPINNGITNILSNLDQVPTILNDLLQANFYQATADTWRLGINSTIGIGGFFDVASKMGIPNNSSDFGLTLAKWGYTNSNYFVVPFFGPRTVRDTFALPVNYFSNVYPYMRSVSLRNTFWFLWAVDQRAQLLRFQKVYEEVAIDPYIFQRNAYLQRRKYEINRTKQLDDPYTEEEMQTMEEDYYLDE